LKKKGVLAWLLACYRFAVEAAREIDKGEAPQCFAVIP
jgi:hypothetical protein